MPPTVPALEQKDANMRRIGETRPKELWDYMSLQNKALERMEGAISAPDFDSILVQVALDSSHIEDSPCNSCCHSDHLGLPSQEGIAVTKRENPPSRKAKVQPAELTSPEDDEVKPCKGSGKVSPTLESKWTALDINASVIIETVEVMEGARTT